MTITVEEQATLRYLLWNYLNLKLMSIFTTLGKTNTEGDIHAGSALAVKYTKQFDGLVADLGHFNNMAKRKKVSTYMFTDENMQTIRMAAKKYDDYLARKVLEEIEFNLVSRNIIKLLDLIDKSSLFKYSYNEIREERARK